MIKPALLSTVLFPFLAIAGNSTFNESLKPWQPLEITTSEDVLTIVLNEKRVTDQIYSSVAELGICSPLWLEKDESYITGIKEISILNKFKKQGYVLEEPLSVCKELGEATGNSGKFILMGKTRMF